jgi:pheromone shutdown protein TraB
VVAVELCEERLWALRDPNRGKLSSPINTGFLPWLLALLERAVGSLTDVFPGTEMLEAVDEAEKDGAQVVLIDKPIRQILDEIGRVPFFEKLRIGADVILALFAVRTKQRGSKIHDTSLEQLMAEFSVKYPTLWRILVEDRDIHMADRLREILGSTSGYVVAVVGFGHVSGINRNLAAAHRDFLTEKAGFRYEWTIGGSPS